MIPSTEVCVRGALDIGGADCDVMEEAGVTMTGLMRDEVEGLVVGVTMTGLTRDELEDEITGLTREEEELLVLEELEDEITGLTREEVEVVLTDPDELELLVLELLVLTDPDELEDVELLVLEGKGALGEYIDSSSPNSPAFPLRPCRSV